MIDLVLGNRELYQTAMGKKNQPEPEKHQEVKLDTQQADLHRRIESIEGAIVELRRSNLEGHKWFTTIMFTLVAILLTVLGIISKSDVREAIRDMKTDTRETTAGLQSKFDKSQNDMDRKFAALSGEAMKRPLLTVTTPRGKLDGQLFELSGASPFPPEPLFITNDGDRSTETLSIRVYMSAPVNSSYIGGPMVGFRSPDTEFPVAYYLDLSGQSPRSAGLLIAAKETWTFENTMLPVISPVTTNVVACKMQFFYGAEKPFEARFTLKWK